MNILFVADSASWHNALWTKFFAQKNRVVLVSDYKPEYVQPSFDEKVEMRVVDIGRRPRNRHLRKILSFHRVLLCCNREVKRLRPDVIHAVAVYYGFLAALTHGRSLFIYTLQGSEVLIQARKNLFYRHLLRFIFRRADLVTGDSRTIIDAAIDLGLDPCKTALVQNGVDVEVFAPNLTGKVSTEVDELKILIPRGLTPLYNPEMVWKAHVVEAIGSFSSRRDLYLALVASNPPN